MIEQIYQHVSGIVCEITGLSYSDVINSNREECVDARSLLINKLLQIGLTERRISEFSGLTTQCVNKLKNTFEERRLKFEYSINLQRINKEYPTK